MTNPQLKDLLMNQLKAGIITPDTILNLKMPTGGDGQETPKASKDLDLSDKIIEMNYQVRSLTYSCNEENIPIYEHRFNGSTDDLKCSCMIRADESDLADFTPAFKCTAKDMENNDGKVFQVVV